MYKEGRYILFTLSPREAFKEMSLLILGNERINDEYAVYICFIISILLYTFFLIDRFLHFLIYIISQCEKVNAPRG